MFEEEKYYEKQLLRYCKHVEGIFIPPPKNQFQRIFKIYDTVKNGYPIICSPYYYPSIAKSLSKITKNQSFDAIQIEHSLLFPYLDSLKINNSCLKLLTLHNIDFIRIQRLFKHMAFSLRKLFYFTFAGRLKFIELDSLKKFNYILTMSDKDNETLTANGFEGQMIPIPNGVDTEAITPISCQAGNKNIVFVGSLGYEANRGGILWFLNKIWPKLSASFSATKLLLVGKNPDKTICSYQSKKVTITGTVDAVEPYYKNARVCIVPLRSGGGTRLKVLEALAYGVPIVSTTIGCEGINVEDKKNILIADSPKDFAVAIELLCCNDDCWKNISFNGRRLVEEQYSWKNIIQNYDKLL